MDEVLFYPSLPLQDSTINKSVLHWQEVAVQEGISPRILENAKFTIEDLHLPEMLAARLTAYVLTGQICGRRVTAIPEVPASWWQHFKQDVLPKRLTRSKWFNNHMPVRLKQMEQIVVFDESRTYPDASIVLPEGKFGQPVIVETITKLPWRERNG